MTDRDRVELQFSAICSPILLTIAAFFVAAMAAAPRSQNTILNGLLAVLAALSILGTAVLADSALDMCGMTLVDRLTFLRGGYFCFCLIAGALTTVVPILYEAKQITDADYVVSGIHLVAFLGAGISVFLKMILLRDRQVFTGTLIAFYALSFYTVHHTSASGAAISINFVGRGMPLERVEVAGVARNSSWNNAAGPSSPDPLSLVDQNGKTTTASVTWNSGNIWSLPLASSSADHHMMQGYLDDANGEPITVSVSGLTPGIYKIYVYCDGDNGGSSRTGVYQISGRGIKSAGITAIDAAGANFTGEFKQANKSAGNYVLFSGVTITSGFTLTATPGAATDGPRAPVNGIQIVLESRNMI